VLVGGGSQAECFFLDQDAAWPGALHRRLVQPDALRRLNALDVHVGSIARSGVGSEALDLIFARVLPRYARLSAIIVQVGASDVLHWLEEGAPSALAGPVCVGDIFRCHPEGPFGWTPRTLPLWSSQHGCGAEVSAPLSFIDTPADGTSRRARCGRRTFGATYQIPVQCLIILNSIFAACFETR
jgi:hypothetical protein